MKETETSDQFRQAATLSLRIDVEQIGSLLLLLQQGFFVSAWVGCSVKDFFIEQLELTPEYIEQRLQGIFLDSKPADDIETALLRDGSRLTLSGTMPGLVGIALRRGPLAVFRHSITHRETGNYDYAGEGFVKLKLLNLLLKDMGPALLMKGIYMNSAELADYLGNLSQEFWQRCKSVVLNGVPVTSEVIQKGQWSPENRMVRFTVVPA